MSEKVLKTTTPTARKEHVCEVCGKPIKKGERYLDVTIKKDGKLVHRKTHFGCRVEKKEESASLPVMPVGGIAMKGLNLPPLPIVGKKIPQTEEEFKKAVHDDTLNMLETFTFQENMEIAFIPLVITELMWIFAQKVVDYAIANRVSWTVKLTRTVKNLREEYLKEVAKDLDKKHQEHFIGESRKFYEENVRDFTILWFSVNQSLKAGWYDLPHLDMRTDAYCAVVMFKVLKEHSRRIGKLILERTGEGGQDFTNPKTDALNDLMEAYVAPAEIEVSQHVKTSMAIMQKKFKLIEFNVK